MSHPKPNDLVIFSYTGLLDNGEIFIASEEGKPSQAVLGKADLPPTLEAGILAMQVGETKKIRIPPEEGYGLRLKELLQTIDNQQLVDTLKPKPGMIVHLRVNKEGVEQQVPATVMSVEGSRFSVDYNHPLAGHHLTYKLTLLEIAPPPMADC
jgi:FKBP-type peptidyl-prolyl cis-trans isomerase SlpA